MQTLPKRVEKSEAAFENEATICRATAKALDATGYQRPGSTPDGYSIQGVICPDFHNSFNAKDRHIPNCVLLSQFLPF